MSARNISLATCLVLLAGGCGPQEDVGWARMGIQLTNIDPSMVGSVTVYVLGAGGGSCTDIYSGQVDPFRPGSGLVGMETASLTGSASATIHFGSIPTGTRLFYVEAYQSSDGSGPTASRLGTGCTRAKVKSGKTVDVSITSVCKRDGAGQCTDS